MKATVKCLLFNVNEECDLMLSKMMLQFSSAMRFAYNEIVRNLNNKDFKPQHLDKLISEKYNLNIRQAKDAIEVARQTKQSQVELLDGYIEDLESKIEVILNKLDNKDLQTQKRDALIRKLDKRLRKLSVYLKHKSFNTLPVVIFGGKENFYKRCKNQISKEEYKQNRNNHFVSRGDKSKKGNPNLRIIVEDNMYFLEITTLEKAVNSKGVVSNKLYKKIRTPLYIPVKVSKKTGKVNGYNYKEKLLEVVAKEEAYQVELIRKNGRVYGHVTFTLDESAKVATGHRNMIGIDTNPNGLALTMIDRTGNYVWHTYLGDHRLLNAKGTIRDNICGELACTAVRIAKVYGAGIAIENLKFKNNIDVKKKFARVKNQFCYSKLISSVESACYKYGVECNKVLPHYTSRIGLIKYCHQYGMYVHNGAAMVIARRAYGFGENVPKEFKKMFIPVHIVVKNKLKLENIKITDEFSKWSHITKRLNWLLRQDNYPRFILENRKNIVSFIS